VLEVDASERDFLLGLRRCSPWHQALLFYLIGQFSGAPDPAPLAEVIPSSRESTSRPSVAAPRQ
jgi:hypothetical protein